MEVDTLHPEEEEMVFLSPSKEKCLSQGIENSYLREGKTVITFKEQKHHQDLFMSVG